MTNMEDITPEGSIVPVYRMEEDAEQKLKDQETWSRLAEEEQVRMLARETALAKLSALGLTEAEIKALLG